jgi:DNA repair photolyase
MSESDAGGVTTGKDPTQAALSESKLHTKALCDYTVNVATGCSHGCTFCYVPSTPVVRMRPEMLAEHADVEQPQQEWGEYVLYRDGLPGRLATELGRRADGSWKRTERGQGVVGLSFATDCYMDPRAAEITHWALTALIGHGRHARVLTRNPMLAASRDRELFAASNRLTIGSSIPTLDDERAAAIEPRAPPPTYRLRGLERFADAGVPVYVSLSPTYPTQEKADLRAIMERLADLDPAAIFHEPINPRGGNFEMTVEAAREAGQTELGDKLDALRDSDRWMQYALRQLRWVQQLGAELDLPIHLWPDDRLLTDAPTAAEREWAGAWQQSRSPEAFGPTRPRTEMPPLPAERGSCLDEF